MFYPSAAICLAFVLWGVVATDSLGDAADSALGWVIETFGWMFVLSTLGFLALAIYLGLSRHGKIRLGRGRREAGVPHRLVGGDDVQRRHGHRADVLRRHRAAVAPRGAAERRRAGRARREAARVAMEYSYFHWAFHPWAIYAIVGLALAYFVFRKGSAT